MHSIVAVHYIDIYELVNTVSVLMNVKNLAKIATHTNLGIINPVVDTKQAALEIQKSHRSCIGFSMPTLIDHLD